MSRVIFDWQVFAEQKYGGVSHYFFELMRALERRGNWTPVVAPGIHVCPLPAEVETVGFKVRIPAFPHRVRALRIANRMLHGSTVGRHNVAVYHPTWYDSTTLDRFAHLPMVLTIHDLIPERWPHGVGGPGLAQRREAIRRAVTVICVSEATRERLVHYYPDSEHKARVARLGLTIDPHTARWSPSVPLTDTARYFAFVGKRGWYKDFETVVRALAKTRDVGLVVAGGGQLEPKFDRLIAELGLANRIRVVPNPSEDRLVRILQSSCGLISASREEGFGLPALEALSLGVPALLTDIAVYRELFSRWAALYPVGDSTTLATLIERTVTRPPPPVPAEVLTAAFSWDRAAAATEAAYAAAAGSD